MRYMVVNQLRKLSIAVAVAAMAIGMSLPASASAASKGDEIKHAKPTENNAEAHKKNPSSLTQNEKRHLYDGKTGAKDKADASYSYKNKDLIKDQRNIAATIFGVVMLLAGIYAFAEHAPSIVKHRRRIKRIKSQQKYSAHSAEHGKVGGIHTRTKITKKEVEERWK